MRDLSKRIANLPEDKRDLLDALLRDEGLDISSLPMRSRRSSGSTSFPLSFAQQRMWFLNQCPVASGGVARIDTGCPA